MSIWFDCRVVVDFEGRDELELLLESTGRIRYNAWMMNIEITSYSLLPAFGQTTDIAGTHIEQ